MPVAARLRLVARATAMLATLLLYLMLHGAWRAVRLRSPWPPRFLGALARAVGVRTTVVGTPVTRDVLYLANHQSWIDILAIAGVSGSAFVAKGELRDAPLVGWLCTLNRTLFVDRGDRLGVARQIDTLRQALLADHPVTVFPEGTTAHPGELLPFKAALLGAIDPPPPGLRVQPVYLDYGDARDVAWVGDEAGTVNAARILARPGWIGLTIHFLPAFDPAGLGRKAVAAQARQAIAGAMATAGTLPASPPRT